MKVTREMLSDLFRYNWVNASFQGKRVTDEILRKHKLFSKITAWGWNEKNYTQLLAPDDDKSAFGPVTYIFGAETPIANMVWIMHTGAEPPSVLKHINGNKADNRITNLSLTSDKAINDARAACGLLSSDTLFQRGGCIFAAREGKTIAEMGKLNITVQQAAANLGCLYAANPARQTKVSDDWFTAHWARDLVAAAYPEGVTVSEAMARSRIAQRDRLATRKAFLDAVTAGLLTCHTTNEGKRGRPRHEFKLVE